MALHLTLLACLHQAAPWASGEPPQPGPSQAGRGLGRTLSAKCVPSLTRAYAVQEIEALLRSTARRWATLARELVARQERVPVEVAAARLKIGAMLRDTAGVKAARRQGLQQCMGSAARLPQRLRSPDDEFTPSWRWRSLDHREAAIKEAYGAAAHAAGLVGHEGAAEISGPVASTPVLADQDIFARLDALIHVEIPDAPPGADLAHELQIHIALAYFYAERRARYQSVLLREADQLRQDATAAWRLGEVETAQIFAAELEYLSVEVGLLEALVAYETALVRVQAIIDRR